MCRAQFKPCRRSAAFCRRYTCRERPSWTQSWTQSWTESFVTAKSKTSRFKPPKQATVFLLVLFFFLHSACHSIRLTQGDLVRHALFLQLSHQSKQYKNIYKKHSTKKNGSTIHFHIQLSFLRSAESELGNRKERIFTQASRDCN